jgi:hypothetical protein
LANNKDTIAQDFDIIKKNQPQHCSHFHQYSDFGKAVIHPEKMQQHFRFGSSQRFSSDRQDIILQ